ncbi:MAG: outer membrane beta-barrel protein [Bacteroidales bacterium]|nr:porin family protein [Bacteroidales bacterium]
MKNLIALSAFFMILSLQAFSQETNETTEQTSVKKPKFWIGPKFGLDMSPITYNFKEISNQLKTNYQAGIMMQYGRTLYLQPEVYYASYQMEGSETSVNFIKVPAMLGLRFVNLGLFSLHLMGGPAFSFQLDNKDSFTGNNTFSWQVGAGIDVLGFITLDARYNLIKDLTIAEQISQFNQETSMLNVTAGLKFR